MEKGLGFLDKQLNELANELATDVLKGHLCEAIKESIAEEIKKQILEEDSRQAHFEKLFKRIARHEPKIKEMLIGIWKEEEKILVANLKKLKKYFSQRKDESMIDMVMYPRAEFETKLSEEMAQILALILAEEGQTAIEELVADAVFNVDTARIQEWIEQYTPRFSESLEEVNVVLLRKELKEGIEAGEGIPQLIKRINKTYDNFYKLRSETIARTEALRATNRANVEAMIQSGVVRKKIWITMWDNKTCPWCERMDGKVVAVEENFFNQGDRFSIDWEEDGRQYHRTMKLDYEDVVSPPLHPGCRCAISPWMED